MILRLVSVVLNCMKTDIISVSRGTLPPSENSPELKGVAQAFSVIPAN